MQRRGASSRILLATLAADVMAIGAAYYTALWFRFHSRLGAGVVAFLNRLLLVPRFETADEGVSFEMFYLLSAPRIIALIAATVLLIYLGMDLYAGRRLLTRRFLAGDIARANGCALLFFFVYFYLSRNQFHPRSMFAVIVVFNTLYTILFRSLADKGLRLLRSRSGRDRCAVLAVGRAAALTPLADWIDACEPYGLYVCNRLITTESSDVREQDVDLWRRKIEACEAQLLLVADPSLSIKTIMRILEMTDEIGIPVKILSEQLAVIGDRAGLLTDRMLGLPLIHFAASPRSYWHDLIKRAYSVGLAALALLILAPLMLIIALAIRWSSRGPALFVQERIGINRVPFQMLKFRTMFQYAEEIQAQVEEFNESGRGLFKIRSDPRITPIGRFLRRFSLDELPQLINVLRGDMSLVGPRPLPRRDLNHYYEDWHYIRHGGLPGLTCLWQVAGRSELDFHSMCLLDTYYLRNQTLALDARILARTVWAVFFARGAY